MRRAPLVLVLLLAGCSVGGGSDEGGGGSPGGPVSPPKSSQPEAAAQLGSPTVATRNTIRVGGGDAVTDLAGVASAVFPPTGKLHRPPAVALVGKEEWRGAIAGSVLSAQPLGPPLLASHGGSLPAATRDVLDRLHPGG